MTCRISLFPFTVNDLPLRDLNNLILGEFKNFRELIKLTGINVWAAKNIPWLERFKVQYPYITLEDCKAFPRFHKLHPSTCLKAICCGFGQKKTFPSGVFEKETYVAIHDLNNQAFNLLRIQKEKTQLNLRRLCGPENENMDSPFYTACSRWQEIVEEYPEPNEEQQAAIDLTRGYYMQLKSQKKEWQSQLTSINDQLDYSILSYEELESKLKNPEQNPICYEILTTAYRKELSQELVRWEDRQKLIDAVSYLKNNEKEKYQLLCDFAHILSVISDYFSKQEAGIQPQIIEKLAFWWEEKFDTHIPHPLTEKDLNTAFVRIFQELHEKLNIVLLNLEFPYPLFLSNALERYDIEGDELYKSIQYAFSSIN